MQPVCLFVCLFWHLAVWLARGGLCVCFSWHVDVCLPIGLIWSLSLSACIDWRMAESKFSLETRYWLKKSITRQAGTPYSEDPALIIIINHLCIDVGAAVVLRDYFSQTKQGAIH